MSNLSLTACFLLSVMRTQGGKGSPGCGDPEGNEVGSGLQGRAPWRVSIADNSPVRVVRDPGSQTLHLRRGRPVLVSSRRAGGSKHPSGPGQQPSHALSPPKGAPCAVPKPRAPFPTGPAVASFPEPLSGPLS